MTPLACLNVDGLGGNADGPEGRWQRYPGRAERSTGGFDRDLEREPDRRFDERDGSWDGERRDFERRERRADGRDEDGYRVPEPRFGDLPAGGRYDADPLREDPLFGGVRPAADRPYDDPRDAGPGPRDGGAFDVGPRDVAPRDGGIFDSGGAFDGGSRDSGLRDGGGRDGGLRDGGPREGGGRLVGPRSGVELPPLGEVEHHLTEQIDRAALRRPGVPGPTGPSPTVYRSRRPALIVLLAIGGATVELLLLFVLVHAMFAGNFAAGGMLASIFAIVGVPFTALGIYALVSGAPAAAGGHPAQAWFRAPMAYLPVGLLLLIAAALAAR